VQPLTTRVRITVAVVTAVSLAAAAVAYIRHSAVRAAGPAHAASAALTIAPGPRLLVVSDRRVAAVSAADPSGPREVSATSCVRVYAAAGIGICLQQTDPWSYSVVVLDVHLGAQRTIPIPGLPNRARVSASGRLVAWTTFVGGDSYNSGGFSTRTGMLDTRTGQLIADLESFAVLRDGRPLTAADRNIWGVTFAADDNRFYATVATGGHRYLAQGDIAARTLRTLTENVECPSISPDGTRIVFKRAIDGDPVRGWRLSVLDLVTGLVTPLAETRSIDDQAAWLDDGAVAYTVRGSDGSPDVWAVPADGTGGPRLLVPGAESPSPL
jgi:hypothetical protein